MNRKFKTIENKPQEQPKQNPKLRIQVIRGYDGQREGMLTIKFKGNPKSIGAFLTALKSFLRSFGWSGNG